MVWWLLLNTGYLNATQTYYDELRGLQADLLIFNKEVCSNYTQMVRSWFSKKKKYQATFLASLEHGDLQSRADAALTQIKEKQYTTTFKNALLIGMAFCGKEMVAAHSQISE